MKGPFRVQFEDAGILLMTDHEDHRVSEYGERLEIGSEQGVHRMIWGLGDGMSQEIWTSCGD